MAESKPEAASTPPGRPQKQMSSRLLTMKVGPDPMPSSSRLTNPQFMQRADDATVCSHASPASQPSPAAPPSAAQSPALPNTPLQTRDQPATPSGLASEDAAAVRAAVAADEARRQQALEKHAREGMETKWALSYMAQTSTPPIGLRVERIGYSELEARSGGGRLRFGNFMGKKRKVSDCVSQLESGLEWSNMSSVRLHGRTALLYLARL